MFPKKEPSAKDNQHDAQLVNWSNAGGGAHLQRAKITEPRESCTDTGQHEKEPAPASDLPKSMMLFQREGDAPGKHQNHGRPNSGREIGVDTGHAHLRQ